LPGGIFAEDTDRPQTTFLGSGGDSEASSSTTPPWIVAVAITTVLLALMLIVVPLVKWVRHRSRMRRLARGDISAAWEDIVVRLSDLGMETSPARTPVEVAAGVDDAMGTLAAVYSRSIYGQSAQVSDEHVTAARRSMEATNDQISTRYSSMERLRSQYRLRSLLWWRFRR
jgi:hypothetical protein